MANYLPVLMHSVTTNIVPDDSTLETQPRGQVDYLSHDWREEDVWRSWRNMTRQKNEIANGMRLENASWRTWWKQRNKLKTINPETLNWLKDSDVTWLYGPLHEAVEWTPPKPTRYNTERKPASAQDRLDLSLPKHKSILKYRTISELLTSELPLSPPPESDGENDGLKNQSQPSPPQRRPTLPHIKSDTHITRWGPDRTFRKDSPPRIDPPGSAGASTANSNTVANPTPTRINSSTNLTSYFSSHLHGHQSHDASQTSSSTSNSASASPRGASSELSSAPAQKKKHITFNTFVEQCIAIDKPKTVNILGNGSGKGMNVPSEDTDEVAEEHDDGYDEDVEGGDDFDPDWGLNECAITDSDSDYEEDIFAQDDDEDDEGDFDNDGVIEMRASRKTKQDKKGILRSKSKASTSSSSSADSYASSPTSDSLKKRRPSIHTIPRRRRSGTLRSNSNATARPSFNHGPRRITSSSSDQMVTIAPIAPTMLKTGGSNTFAYPAHSPAWDGFGVHPDTSSGYGGWMDGFGDEALSEDGGFGGPMGRYSGSSGWRSSDSDSPGTPVELVYMPPPSGRYGATYSGRSSISRGGSRIILNVNSEEAEVELMEEAGEARRLGREETEEHVQMNGSLLDSQDKSVQRSQSQRHDNIGKEQGQVYHYQEAVFSTVNSNSSKSHEREKKSKRRPTSIRETSTGLAPSVPIVVRTPPAVQRPGRNSDDEMEEDAYDYFGGPDLGEDYATRRTTRRNPKDRRHSSSIPDEQKSRSHSRSKSRTPSPQSITPAIAVPGRNSSSSAASSSALLSPPLRGRGAAHQSSLSPDSSSRGRSSTRTSSSSMSDREWPRSRSSHSSPIGSLSPDGSTIGLNYGVYANGKIGDREREREKDRERAYRRGGRGRERTERRLSHSLSPDNVEGVTIAAVSLPSSPSLGVINSPSPSLQSSSETAEGTSSTSSSQTILPPSPPPISPKLGSLALDAEPMPSVPTNTPVISISGAAIAIAGMDQNSDHGRTNKNKLSAPPMDVTQPHISSPKTSYSVDPSPKLTSNLTSTEHDSVLPDGSLTQAHVIRNSTPTLHGDDTGKETRGQATTTSDDSSIVGKTVGNIMTSARAYLGLWNSGERENDDS